MKTMKKKAVMKNNNKSINQYLNRSRLYSMKIHFMFPSNSHQRETITSPNVKTSTKNTNEGVPYMWIEGDDVNKKISLMISKEVSMGLALSFTKTKQDSLT